MNKPKHRTSWKYTDKGSKGTFIRVGFVSNSEAAHDGYHHDSIRLQIRSDWEGQGDIDFCVRLDEASSISAGLSKVAADMLAGLYGKKSVRKHAKALDGSGL
jgi:hypothetical protein